MKKRTLSKLEAIKLTKKLAESVKLHKVKKLLKKEEVEAGEVYAVVTPTSGEASVTFKNGELMVGPFASEEEAKAAVGDDVQLVTGDADTGEVAPMSDEMLVNDEMSGEPMMEKKIRSNMLRMRKQVVESIRSKVKADILSESEALDIDTDAVTGEESKESGEAGALDDGGQIASFVSANDTGSTENDIDTDQSADADSSDDNLLEAKVGQLVNVFDRKTMAKVDTGIVESIKAGKVQISESDTYDIKQFKFQKLA